MFRQHVEEIMWVTIESGSTEQGIPDIFGCAPRNICFWVECKQCAANAVKIRPGQIAWHERYARMGGRSFFAIRRDRELFLYAGSKARKLATAGLASAIPLGRWTAPWDWIKIRRILVDSPLPSG